MTRGKSAALAASVLLMGALLAVLGTKLVPISRENPLDNRAQPTGIEAPAAGYGNGAEAPAAGYGNGGNSGNGGGTGAAPAAPVAGGVPAAPAGTTTKSLTGRAAPKMGDVVVDDQGWVLYRFDKDTADPAASNCIDQCAKVWPPVLVDEAGPAVQGVKTELVGSITRADGGKQVTLDGWPLYRYVGDTGPGQWKGQAVGGTWFVVAPTGKKNLSCLPTTPPTAAAPPAESGSTGGNY